MDLKLAIGGMRYKAREAVWKWAERELIIPPSMSPNHYGPFRVTGREYMKEPLECFADPGVTDMTIMAGGQILKTTVFIVGAAWMVAHSPRPALFVYPNENLAKEVSSDRWMRLFEASPGLRGLVPARRDDWSKLFQRGTGWRAKWVGSNSPANLSSSTFGLVISDELEKFAAESKNEASAVRLAELRTKDYGARGFRAAGSTPTVDSSDGWIHYLTGTCEECLFECVHCGGRFVMDHNENFQWSGKRQDGTWDLEEVERTAHFVCPDCGKSIWSEDRSSGMRECQWRATREASRAGHRSFWLPSFYAPSLSFGYMARRFLLCHQTHTLRDYFNGDLGKPFEERLVSVKGAHVENMRGGYKRGELPERPLLLGIFADPGDMVTHWAALAFYPGGEIRAIDWGAAMDPRDVIDLAKTRVWPIKGGGGMRATVGLMDSGDRATDVYDYCYNSGGLFYPSKGVPATDGIPFSITELKTHGGMPLYKYRDYDAKNDLYERRIERQAEPRFLIPDDADHDFKKGFSGQEKVKKRVGNRVFYVWKKIDWDHFGDCGKLGVVFWWFVQAGMR